MVSYMDGRFVIFYLLLDYNDEERKMLIDKMDTDSEDFHTFKDWAKRVIKIDEENGEVYSDDFKALFD